MVRYATRDVDPYIRGLPTSDLFTYIVEKAWIESAILREIKMPLEDFYWMRYGVFDAHYVGCKFIHDHYMDIEYFPWPQCCLPDIKYPNFDDGFDHWMRTSPMFWKATKPLWLNLRQRSNHDDHQFKQNYPVGNQAIYYPFPYFRWFGPGSE